jgi:hypothetical protein
MVHSSAFIVAAIALSVVPTLAAPLPWEYNELQERGLTGQSPPTHPALSTTSLLPPTTDSDTGGPSGRQMTMPEYAQLGSSPTRLPLSPLSLPATDFDDGTLSTAHGHGMTVAERNPSPYSNLPLSPTGDMSVGPTQRGQERERRQTLGYPGSGVDLRVSQRQRWRQAIERTQQNQRAQVPQHSEQSGSDLLSLRNRMTDDNKIYKSANGGLS